MKLTNQDRKLFSLVSRLRFEGYEVTLLEDSCVQYLLKGKGVEGCITEYTIYADSKKCYDKPSKCPLILPLPISERQYKWLLERLKFWASAEGFKLSNNYEYDYFDKEYQY